MGERHAPLFRLEYSCASLILVEYSCLAVVFAVSSKFLYVSRVEISVSFEESTLLIHLYLFGELLKNKLIGVWLDQKVCCTCGSGINACMNLCRSLS